jgi:ribonuclease HII
MKPQPPSSLGYWSIAMSNDALCIAGVDEAGRGPLAGPVVVAAVILDAARPIEGLADSKALSARQREALRAQILAHARATAIVCVAVEEIDLYNIFQATMRGMSRALRALTLKPELALIDGNKLPKDLPCQGRAIVKGDQSEACISAASILAKTTRDALMIEAASIYPGYGFEVHKGYPTPTHLAALRSLGACAIHRRSFAPVQNAPVQQQLF